MIFWSGFEKNLDNVKGNYPAGGCAPKTGHRAETVLDAAPWTIFLDIPGSIAGAKFSDGLAAGARGSKQALRDCAGGKGARER